MAFDVLTPWLGDAFDVRRTNWLLIAGAALVTVVVALTVFTMRWRSRPQPAPAPPPEQTAKNVKPAPQPQSPVTVLNNEERPQAQAPRVRPGQELGRIVIPRLHVATPIFEGADEAELKRGAGHVPSTALPGADGNVAIAAHRDKFFRALRNIRAKDEITLDTPHGVYHYVVRRTEIVTPKDVRVLRPTPDPELTLVTCYPFYYVGHAPKRFIVHAERAS
ncbi:MAG TPA: class D sortase [Bryobacteraceae bacterium]|nr:class D sortase [Bryobacteraceae bacterium]